MLAAFGLLSAATLAGGCAAELADPDAYSAARGGSAPAAGGTPGAVTGGTPGSVTGGTPGAATGGAPAATGGSTSSPTPELPACVPTALSNATCTSCHAPATKDFFGGLDLMGADVGTRLRDATAKNMVATNAAACGTKLIDSDNPAQSVFLKRISGTSDCGPAMPSGNGVTGPDLECLKTWIMSF